MKQSYRESPAGTRAHKLRGVRGCRETPPGYRKIEIPLILMSTKSLNLLGRKPSQFQPTKYSRRLSTKQMPATEMDGIADIGCLSAVTCERSSPTQLRVTP